MTSFSLVIATDEKITLNNEIKINIESNTVEQWDWRNVDGNDWTTPVRNQLQDQCGSCWAFGALGAVEANYKLWMNDPTADVDFSEQYILSCSSGNCNGWFLSRTLSWIERNGVINEACMPYEADDTIPCESKCEDWRDQLVGTTDHIGLSRADIQGIKDALITYGPLPATMNVYGDFYPDWDGGVYQQSSEEYVFGHVITIVGFNDNWGDEDEGYWICKNSWGTNWGEDGWFRIAYGECSIENSVYYLTGPNYPPLQPDQPTGISKGKPGTTYTFSSSGIDPDGNDIYYMFDWGDGNQTDWIGPLKSGETVQANYTWEQQGSYSVTIKTMDHIGPYIRDVGLQSEWSEPLTVAMPHQKNIDTINTIIDYLNAHFPFFTMDLHWLTPS